MDEENKPESLTVDQGVDSGGTIDPSGDGAVSSSEEGSVEDKMPGSAPVDGTGNGALLSTTDQHTGGPGQEMSVGEGGAG